MCSSDLRVTLSEFVLETILEWTLAPKLRGGGSRQCRELAGDVALVLSLLAHADTGAAAALAKFDKGRQSLAMPDLALLDRDALQLSRVVLALERLCGLAPPEKQRAIAAFALAIEADGEVRLKGHELLRAVACVMDCPMPPSVAALDPRLLRK